MEQKVYYDSMDGLKLCGVFTIPERKPVGFVLMAHGITTNKDESGIYTRIANRLCREGYEVLRFDFRAHGESEGKQREMTVSGEIMDLEASVEQLLNRGAQKVGIVVSSFGGGPCVMYTHKNNDKVGCVVLLQPVLDYTKTFLEPELPWAKQSFNEKSYENLSKKGYLLLDGIFEIGAPLIEEFKKIRPYEHMKFIICPVLTIHGDKDTKVPYEVALKYHKCNEESEFMTIKGADHGFGEENEGKVTDAIVNWLNEHLKRA